MSLIDDVRAISGNALEQLAARFSDLPRPLLVAIGAGDMALARFAELKESLVDSLGDRVSVPAIDASALRATVAGLPARAQKLAAEGPATAQKVAAEAPGRARKLAAEAPAKAQKLAAEVPAKAQKLAAEVPARAQQVTADLPAKAQRVAVDVAGSIEQFAADAPAKVQEMVAQLPDRLAEVQTAVRSLSPDMVRETVDAYGRLAEMIYGKLADRGSQSWIRVRSTGLRTAGSTGGEAENQAAPEQSAPATAAARAAAAASARASAAAARAAAAVRATTHDPAPHGEPATADPTRAASGKGQQARRSAVRDGDSGDLPHAGRKRDTRAHARTVTTPDGTARVTVAPQDVVPKGAHVKPTAPGANTRPPKGRTSAHHTPADPGTTGDQGDTPIGI